MCVCVCLVALATAPPFATSPCVSEDSVVRVSAQISRRRALCAFLRRRLLLFSLLAVQVLLLLLQPFAIQLCERFTGLRAWNGVEREIASKCLSVYLYIDRCRKDNLSRGLVLLWIDLVHLRFCITLPGICKIRQAGRQGFHEHDSFGMAGMAFIVECGIRALG